MYHYYSAVLAVVICPLFRSWTALRVPKKKTNLLWCPEPHGFVNNTIHSKLFIESLPQFPCRTHKKETLLGVSREFAEKVNLPGVRTFHNGKTFSLTDIVFVEVIHYFRQKLQFLTKMYYYHLSCVPDVIL